jgi:phospholipid/cholesterol/gamma-HCH transport system ATP-binding protein
MSSPVMEWEHVMLPAHDTALPELDVSLQPGEGLLVYVDSRRRYPPIADAACGLVSPVQGRIRFQGRDWQDRMAGGAAIARSRIGRVFEGHAWVSNLDLDENITLAQRHHTGRTEHEIIAEAENWARRFGLDALPAVRPAKAGHRERMKAQWIRALLGEPHLLLLERAGRDVTDEELLAWIAAVKEQLKRGAAMIWLTSDEDVWSRMSTFDGMRTLDIRRGQEKGSHEETI